MQTGCGAESNVRMVTVEMAMCVMEELCFAKDKAGAVVTLRARHMHALEVSERGRVCVHLPRNMSHGSRVSDAPHIPPR